MFGRNRLMMVITANPLERKEGSETSPAAAAKFDSKHNLCFCESRRRG